MKNRTMNEMNEQFKDCPIEVNEYQVDGITIRLHCHFVGDKDINDIMHQYAERRATGEMIGHFAEIQTA